jgi:5-hydroxyisourate hydrolase-like protein (transthyretin family)
MFIQYLQKENIEIKVNNIIGQEVFKRQSNNFSGKFNQALDLKTLEEGTYVLSLKIGTKYYTQKFIVAK